MSYNVRYALVRDLANTFQSALRQDAHGESIDVRKAKLQHEAYSAALKELVPELSSCQAVTITPIAVYRGYGYSIWPRCCYHPHWCRKQASGKRGG